MEYRLANASDADAVAAIISTTWNTNADRDWIARLVGLPEHAIWLAVDRSRVLGFCAGFPTTASDGTRRWEVDLLAVEAALRGHGFGRELVGRCVSSGIDAGAAYQRALIAVDNFASERSFASHGFAAESTCELWVGGPAARRTRVRKPAGAHLIPVDTLTYRGIWVEDNASSEALRGAQAHAQAEGRGVVGIVVPLGTPHEAQNLGFTMIDTYRWWVMKR